MHDAYRYLLIKEQKQLHLFVETPCISFNPWFYTNDQIHPTAPGGYLMRWAQQGVLLLNATLTVREGHDQVRWGHLASKFLLPR